MEPKSDNLQEISELTDWLDLALVESVLDPASSCLERFVVKLEPQTRTLQSKLQALLPDSYASGSGEPHADLMVFRLAVEKAHF